MNEEQVYEYRIRYKGGEWTAWSMTLNPAKWVVDTLEDPGRRMLAVHITGAPGDLWPEKERHVQWRRKDG